MIKLGKLTDYAIVVIVQLAQEAGVSRSAHYLAERTGVPEPTVAKVLKKMARAGLIESVRGAAGGYKAIRRADQMSVAEVITALDGPIAIVTCVEGSKDGCAAQVKCPVRGNWDKVNNAIKGALTELKLSELSFGGCAHSYDFIGTEKNARHA